MNGVKKKEQKKLTRGINFNVTLLLTEHSERNID